MKTQRIGWTELPNGYRVSTVFIDDVAPEGLPYETMVFRTGSWSDVECRRATTLYWAGLHHQQLVAKYGSK